MEFTSGMPDSGEQCCLLLRKLDYTLVMPRTPRNADSCRHCSRVPNTGTSTTPPIRNFLKPAGRPARNLSDLVRYGGTPFQNFLRIQYDTDAQEQPCSDKFRPKDALVTEK
jgi:hypothetical protein